MFCLQPTESPDKAHPIMGIVVTALAVANVSLFKSKLIGNLITIHKYMY